MATSQIQTEIICYLPDKDEPIILPSAMEDFVRAKYLGHPQELKVRIQPYMPKKEKINSAPVIDGQIFEQKKQRGRPKKEAVN